MKDSSYGLMGLSGIITLVLVIIILNIYPQNYENNPIESIPIFAVTIGSLYCAIYGIIKYSGKKKSNEIVIDAKLVDVEIGSSKDSPTLPKGYSWNGILTESDLNDNFSKLSWENAEDLVGTLFSKKGYDSTVTQRSGDFGIDVEAKNDREFLGIQVKHWNGYVDFDSVAKTLGVQNKYNKVIIVSTKSGFSSHALTWASREENRYRIELWDSNRFKKELRQFVLNE